MSKGTRIYTLRIEDELAAEVFKAIDSANKRRREQPYTLTSWIKAAIREKIDHLHRPKGKSNVTIPSVAETVEGDQAEQEPRSKDGIVVVHRQDDQVGGEPRREASEDAAE